jgi:hypothetical protein
VASEDRTYFIPAGLALVCVLLGGGCFAMAGYFVSKAEVQRSWSSTSGVVVTNFLSTYKERDTRTGSWYDRTSRIFAYTFEVDGRAYEGSAYGFGDETVHTVDFDAKYPVGTAVEVFYDPQDPSEAALFVGGTISPTPFYALGIGLIVLGLPFAYLAYRMSGAKADSVV